MYIQHIQDLCQSRPSTADHALSLFLLLQQQCESESHVTTDGQSASLSWNKAPIWCLRPDLYYCLTIAGLLIWGALSDESGSVVCNCYWPSPAQSFSGPSPVGLLALFYYLRFETSLFVASYDSQGHGGCSQPRLHTGSSQQQSDTLQLFNYLRPG
jgi:hypothetical protein